MSTTGNRHGRTDYYWIMDGDGSNKRRLTHFSERGHPEYVDRKAVVELGPR